MPNRPDGKPAGVEKVTFTRPAAERIAAVVREVEQGDRGAQALTFRRVGGSLVGKHFRIATFTGAWSRDQQKTVTFAHGPTGTAIATNVALDIPANPGTVACAIHAEGTSWYVITPPPLFRACTFAPPWPKNQTKVIALLSGGGAITAHNLLAEITDKGGAAIRNCVVAAEGTVWYVTNFEHHWQDIVTNVTEGSDSITFARAKIQVVSMDTHAPISISITECPT